MPSIVGEPANRHGGQTADHRQVRPGSEILLERAAPRSRTTGERSGWPRCVPRCIESLSSKCSRCSWSGVSVVGPHVRRRGWDASPSGGPEGAFLQCSSMTGRVDDGWSWSHGYPGIATMDHERGLRSASRCTPMTRDHRLEPVRPQYRKERLFSPL